MIWLIDERIKSPPFNQMDIAKKDSSLRFKGNTIEAQYVRNNRGRGAKSLRCFPTHKAQGHVQRGFCGTGIQVEVPGDISLNDIVLLQIVPKDTPQYNHSEEIAGSSTNSYVKLTGPKEDDPLVIDIKTGGTYMKSDVDKYVKYTYLNSKRINKQKLYIAYSEIDNAKSDSSKHSKLTTFTALPKWWSYAWKSNKSSRVTEHVVRAYYMKAIDGPQRGLQQLYKCHSFNDSSSFRIKSSKMEYNRKIVRSDSMKRRAGNMSSAGALTNQFQYHNKGAKRLKSRQTQTSFISTDEKNAECETDLIKAIMGDEDSNAIFSAGGSAKELFDEDVLFEGI